MSQVKACKAEAQPASWRQREGNRSGPPLRLQKQMHRGRTAESESAAVPSKEAAQLAKGAKEPAVVVWRGQCVRLRLKMEMSVKTTYG